jgi:CRP-like cAMP-binding protein
MQRTFLELGFIPAAYIPARVFHEVERLDIVKFVKLYCKPDFSNDKLIEQVVPIARGICELFTQQDIEPLILEQLEVSHLFRGLSEEQQRTVARLARSEEIQGGGEVFTANRPSENLFVVLRGAVNICMTDDKLPIGQIQAGECLGEVSALSDSPHSATAIAHGAVLLASIATAELKQLIRARPDIGVLLYKNLATGLGRKLGRTDTAFIETNRSITDG